NRGCRHVVPRSRRAGAGHAPGFHRARQRAPVHDRARRHAQWPRHLPRRHDLLTGRHGLCLRLQQRQPQHGGLGLPHRLPGARPRRRPPAGARRGPHPGGPDRGLRHHGPQPDGWPRHRAVPRQIAPHPGHGDRHPAHGRPEESVQRAQILTGPSANRITRHRRQHIMPVKTVQAGDLEPIETASRDEIAALQLERLRQTLRNAYENVPHYRQAFDARGVHPDDLQRLEDIRKFPCTTKEDLRRNYPFGMFAVPRERLARLHASSGTTGKPTVVGYTLKDLDTWAQLVARSIRAAGGRAGDTVHVAYGYGLFTGGLGAHYGAERAGCTVIPMSGGQTEKQVQLIMDLRPDIIMVTPSYSLVIAEEFDRQGIAPDDISLKVGIFGAEPWGEGMRTEIERKLGLDAVDIY